jgi:retron-type reverse transcriptase
MPISKTRNQLTGCYDHIDHQVLVSIVAEDIHDKRCIRLLSNMLKAGYLETWRSHATLRGTPPGSIASPILANAYLNRLDRLVEQTLLPTFNRGDQRRTNPA